MSYSGSHAVYTQKLGKLVQDTKQAATIEQFTF